MAPLRLPSIPQSLLSTPDPSATRSKSGSISGAAPGVNTLHLCERDIQQTAKFVREFVSMSLVPWMEKYVADWNENVAPASLILGPYVDAFNMFPVCLDAKTTFPSFFLNSSSLWLWNCVACASTNTRVICFPCPIRNSIRVAIFDIKYPCWGTSSSKSAETTSRIRHYIR